jgi:hypothetical protein
VTASYRLMLALVVIHGVYRIDVGRLADPEVIPNS